MNPGNLGLLVIVAMVERSACSCSRRRAADASCIPDVLVPDAVGSASGPLFAPATDAQLKSVALGDAGRLAVLGAGLALWSEHPHPGGGHRQLPVDHLRPETRHRHGRPQRVRPGRGRGRAPLAGRLPAAVRLTARDLNRALRQSERAPQVGLRWLVLATRTNLILLLVVSLFAEAWKEFYILLITGTPASWPQIYDRAAAEPARRGVTPTPVAYVMPRMCDRRSARSI